MDLQLDWAPVPGPVGQLFESARWIPSAGVFQWVDILEATLSRWAPGHETVQVRALDIEFATVAIPIDADRSVIASRSSLHEYSWSLGTLTTLGTWEFPRDVRFNDGGLSPAGSLFVGTMSMDRRPGAGGLYRFAAGALERVLSGVGISNGIAWTESGRAVYVDSLVPRINIVDLTLPHPELTTFAELKPSEEPDGLLITADGEVLVASWGNHKLIRLGPDGSRRSDVHLPARYPTSVAIGGRDRQLMLVTTARHDPQNFTAWDGRVLVASTPRPCE